MNILIIGAGAYGLALATVLSEKNTVTVYSVNKEEINNNINEILYNALFSYKIFDMYANRNELPGNYIDLLFSYSIEVDWDELYKSFIHFLSFSLIKK